MPTCNYCGDEIEFRYVDGRPTPIHVNGGWCTGYGGKSESSARPFASSESYVNPNAYCPVCGDKVFFYKSPFGGRVFFNDLGWPWDKHSCTDNPRSQSGHVQRLTPTRNKTFRNKQNEPLDLFELVLADEDKEAVHLKFRRIGQLIVFHVSVPHRVLRANGVTVKDLQSAPSFVVRVYDTYRLLEFISGRRGKIVELKVSRVRANQG